MSIAPGFQGSTSRLLTLVKLMLNSDQIPSVITAEKIRGTGEFQIWRATSPAGWSQLQIIQQTLAPPQPNTLIKGAGRALEPAVLTLGTFFTVTFDVCMGQSIWAGACMFISRVLWEGLCWSLAGRDFSCLLKPLWQFFPSIHLVWGFNTGQQPMNHPRGLPGACSCCPSSRHRTRFQSRFSLKTVKMGVGHEAGRGKEMEMGERVRKKILEPKEVPSFHPILWYKCCHRKSCSAF